ncbi:39S ribosomal protein L19, mitochondrial [Chelonus insularis]|uniref:39S ribosomal protein L19, mitochondrial n=1 Tax=Chelonus insularis TaxID=460826 RepID=UPI00158B3E1E|nr:39S ribosomal protein L19, mitochondrial [Chelonus insularis]
MAMKKLFSRDIWKNLYVLQSIGKESRRFSTAASAPLSTENETQTNKPTSTKSDDIPTQYRFIYPEFLPDPVQEHRNFLREKLERMDMIARRTIVEIPEFYVGSILAVNYTDPHTPGKKSRFVGICIQRQGCGLRANFTLRNVIDHQGIEIIFHIYDPAIQKVECLRLERRLDDELVYLRDAPNEYSTFPVDMEMELLPEGSPVPLNKTIVPLKAGSWIRKWEQKGLKGISYDYDKLTRKRKMKMKMNEKPWEPYDLMKIYRETIPEEEQQTIFSEIFMKLHSLEVSRKKLQRKRSFVRPKKQG